MSNYRVFCLSYDNLERKTRMKNKFESLELDYLFYDGVSFNDSRINPESYKRAWSCMYGHLDMIKMFYNDPSLEYGVFCEDDILIHKDIKKLIPQLINDFQYLKLDVLLLGYLCPFKITSFFEGFHLKHEVCYSATNIRYHDFTNDIWGTQMYLLSKENAKRILDKYDEASNYALKTLSPDARMIPFSADWTITKDGNRALTSPCLAIEDPSYFATSYEMPSWQYNFHLACYNSNYSDDVFV